MATTYEQFYRQALAQQNQAIQPALSAFQALVPITQQTYDQRATSLESQRPLLQERYDNLLSEINRKQTQETGQVSQNLSREYGKRGIPLSSGVFGEGLQEKLSPIQQFYTGQTKDVGLSREQSELDLANQIAQLPIERQGALQGIYNQMASLRSQSALGATSNALQRYQLELDRQRAAQPDPLAAFLARYQARLDEPPPAPAITHTPVTPVARTITEYLSNQYIPKPATRATSPLALTTPKRTTNPFGNLGITLSPTGYASY